ncbi:MAG: hypothetical protein NTW03_03430, partial [Verrucomicrobia bacterium]|nr:hypothetical protein [Verrucomicrobiota bacterium]
GYQSAIASVVVLDNELPNVSLVIARRSVSEGDGPQATVVTITRTPVSARAVALEVTSSDPGLVLAPAAVAIPAGQPSVSFPIGVVDDSLVNGTRNVTLRVFVLDTFGNVIAEGTPDTIEILDDDGPTLKLALARHLVPQGANPATTAVVTRNTATNTALTVTLASSDTTGITVPANVVLPAGATTVSFNLVSQLGGITNGNQSVVVTASAAGFTPGSDVIVVSDLALPDFVIANVIAPTNGMTEANFTISYRVENRGLSPSTTPFMTRVSLSTDIFGGGGTLLGEFPFDGTLPVNSFIEQTSQFQWPSAAGRYWVVIVADATNQVLEGLENNNTFVSALPINVTAAYTATVQTDVTIAPAGTAVPMSGSAVSTDTGLPAPNVSVNVHVVHGSMQRLLAAQTDLNGNFTTTFIPLPGEAGLYEIGAAHPSAATAPAQDAFTLVGLSADPPSLDLTLPELSSITGQISLQNLGDSPLTQLSVAILDNPPVLNVAAQIGNNGVLPASGSVPLAYAITALQSPNRQTGTVRLRVTATNGVSLDIPLNITIEPLRPRLVANPTELQRSPVRGRQVSVEFEVANEGGAASGPLQISLPPLAWLSLASTNPAPSLAPGETNRVTLLPTALSGVTGSGLAISSGAAAGGRIFIIGREPILDAGLGADGSPLLTLYGLPGHFYAIEARANLTGPGVWSKVGENDLAGTSASLAMPSMAGSVFYRASEMPGPALSITRATGQLLMDWSLGCVNCQLQESTQLGAGANWQLSPIQPQTVNGRYHVSVPDNIGTRFYRLIRP